MARPARSSDTRHGTSVTKHPLLDHYLFNDNPPHRLVHPLLDKSHVHYEHDYFVCVPRSWCLACELTLPLRMLIVLAFASTVSWIVRYRYLNMYARLPPELQRKEPQIELFPDTQDGDSKPGLANYLDEFLSAIKVFGYRKPMVVRC